MLTNSLNAFYDHGSTISSITKLSPLDSRLVSFIFEATSESILKNIFRVWVVIILGKYYVNAWSPLSKRCIYRVWRLFLWKWCVALHLCPKTSNYFSLKCWFRIKTWHARAVLIALESQHTTKAACFIQRSWEILKTSLDQKQQLVSQ